MLSHVFFNHSFSIIFKEAETQRQDLLVSDAAEELISFSFFSFNFEIFGIIKTNTNAIRTVMETHRGVVRYISFWVKSTSSIGNKLDHQQIKSSSIFRFLSCMFFFFHEKLQTQIDVWNKKEWYFTICTNLWEFYVVLHHVRRKIINLSNVRNQTLFVCYWNSLFFLYFKRVF